jgi:hypothetical protein
MSKIMRYSKWTGLVMCLGVIGLIAFLPVAAIRVPIDSGQLTDWTYPDDPLVSVFGLLLSGFRHDDLTAISFSVTVAIAIMGPVLILFSRLRHLREDERLGDALARVVLITLSTVFLVRIPSFGVFYARYNFSIPTIPEAGRMTLFVMRANWIWMFAAVVLWGFVEILTLVLVALDRRSGDHVPDTGHINHDTRSMMIK